jgi:hypothetical protein
LTHFHVNCTVAFDFTHRVTALALTDSVHSRASIKGQPVIEWFDRNARDWIASKEMLDKDLPYHTNDAGCPCVSAGQLPHLPKNGTISES